MFSSILPNLALYAAGFALIAGAIGGALYSYHFKPINKLEETIKEQSVFIKEQKFEVKNLKVKVQNGTELLEKCKAEAIVSQFEIEVNTEANNLDELYQSYLDYKEDLNETIIEVNTTKPSIRFIF